MPGGNAFGEGPEPFACETSIEAGKARARPIGELDLATVPMLDERLRALVGARPRELVIDLAALTFIDSSGLHLLIKWSERAAAEEWSLILLPGPRVVQRLFELAGVQDMLPFAPPQAGGESATADADAD